MSLSTELISSLLQEEKTTLFAPAALQQSSSGALINHELINIRSGCPERGGLFCSKIFGPVEDNCCLCTKYNGEKCVGLTCERCGVLVGSSSMRAKRFGHIPLAAPLPHPLFTSTLAAQLSLQESTLTQILAGELFVAQAAGELRVLSYQEGLDEPSNPGEVLAAFAAERAVNSSAEGGEWLRSRGLGLADLFLRSFVVVPPALRPIVWRPKPNPSTPPEDMSASSFYARLAPEILAKIKARERLIHTHEPLALGVNRRYQDLIKQNEQLKSCLQYEAPTQILLREYAALYHCVHSFFWVGKDSLIKLFLTNQDTDHEEVALYGLALMRR